MQTTPEDRTQIVEAKLVEKRTFLHFEAQEHEDCCQPRLRAKSDTFIDYDCGSEMDSCDDSTATGSCPSTPLLLSCKSSLCGDPLEQLPTGDHEDDSDLPQSSDTCTEVTLGDVCDNDAHRTQPAQPMAADVVQQTLQTNAFSPQEQVVYYYIAMPAAPMWCQGHAQSNVLATPHSTSAATEALELGTEALELEAQAAELRAQAARLKATQPCDQSFLAQPQAMPSWKQELTTLMLRNIPNDYTREMFLDLLNSMGLAGKYDFVYLPIDFTRMCGLGYGFVNFASQADAELARFRLAGFSQWTVQSQKVCKVCWGEPLQGLEAHIERFRSSPVMHRDVPDECKPVIFQAGVRVPFPAPTRRVRAPRPTRNGYE